MKSGQKRVGKTTKGSQRKTGRSEYVQLLIMVTYKR